MSRYGIAEWYGHSFLDLLPHDRRRFSEVALTGQAPPPCPFRQMPCNKRGGVCSIQPYEPDGDHISHAVGHPVIVCPVRFEQQQILIRWLAEVVGFFAGDYARSAGKSRSCLGQKPESRLAKSI